MPTKQAALAPSLVIFAKNKKRVSAFYQATLALRVAESSPSHDLLLGQGFELLIHTIPHRIAASITLSKPPQIRQDTPIKPAFVVTDLAALRAAATRCGGGLKTMEAAWTIRGALVLDGWDPEGNVVQFKQPLA